MSPESPRATLSPAQARRFRILRGTLVGCLAGSGVFAVAGVALLFVPGTSALLRALAWGIFFELAASAAVLGGFARCPACRGRVGTEPGRLLPRRCASCGVALETG